MRNVDVLFAFVNGLSRQKTKSLFIKDDRLYHHTTCLAERIESEGECHFVVNTTKYSQSTTTIQNQLLKMIPNDALITKDDIIKGAEKL